jgi:hypothetical protein
VSVCIRGLIVVYRKESAQDFIDISWQRAIFKRSELNLPYPDINTSLNQLLATTVASNLQQQRKIELHINHDVIKLALIVADSLSNIPLLGVDIIRDASTGEYYVIETNSGGNTWHSRLK